MILNKKLLTLYFSFFSASLLFAQEKVSDTTKIEQLEEVIVTGQYNPQSIKKSVHNVIVIDREKIEKQAANNLADVLNFNLSKTILEGPKEKLNLTTITQPAIFLISYSIFKIIIGIFLLIIVIFCIFFYG